MAEYIFKEAERSSYLTANTNEIITTLEKKESIVRCRDCKYFDRIDEVCDRYGEYPSCTGCWFAINQDGFCSRGERRRG